MAFVRYLAVLPFLGILVGVPLLNRVEPLIFGMPLILAWIVMWIVLTSAIMTAVYICDPANREGGR
jgi:xanthosine utilization system XapX-like protein